MIGLISIALILSAVLLTIFLNHGATMAKLESISAQIDALTAAFNDETNALAARIDAFEIAAGGTVTQSQIDALKAISDRLKALGAPPEVAPLVVVAPAEVPVEAPVVVADEPAPTRPSKAPKA